MTQTSDVERPATTVPAGRPDWRGEYAYAVGVMAFVYGFPYIYNAKLRHDWVTKKQNPDVVPYAAVNHFWHAGRLLDATFRAGGCPSTDFLYSIAWLDLGREPVILSHPDTGGRYFTFQLAAFTSDNFGYVGQRTTGSAAGDFAVVGPGWDGDLPPGVHRVQPSPTPWALVLGRTAVTGGDDLGDARALQEQYRLTPLSLWDVSGAIVPDRRDVYAPAPAAEDPLGPWKTLNAMLAENPPPPRRLSCSASSVDSASAPAWTSRLRPQRSERPWLALRWPGWLCSSSSSPAATGRPSRTAGGIHPLRRDGSATPSCGGRLTSPWRASPPTTPPSRCTCSTSRMPTGRSSLRSAATSCVSAPTNCRPWTPSGRSPRTPRKTSTSFRTRRPVLRRRSGLGAAQGR